jgi:carbon monoxide dehydrogenase subunit G
MKLRHEIVIEADQDSVRATFDNPENMKGWQPALESFTRRSGEDCQPGAAAETKQAERAA